MASTGLDLNGKRNCHRDPRNQFGRMNVHTLVSVTLANAERTNPGHLSVKDNESNGGRRDGKQWRTERRKAMEDGETESKRMIERTEGIYFDA